MLTGQGPAFPGEMPNCTLGAQPLSLERADKATLAAKLSAVERHLRNNALAAGTTLTGRGRLTRVASAREPKAALGAPHSKRLAFFLFHNVLRARDRRAPSPPQVPA